MRYLKWDRRQNEQVFEDMENLLASRLTPIKPRPGFIEGLKNRLTAYPTPAPVILKIAPRAREQRNLLWGLAGVVSGVILLWVGLRSLAGLLKRKAVNQLDKVKTKPVLPNPAT